MYGCLVRIETRRPEEGFGFLGTGATDSCEVPRSSARAASIFNAEPSTSPAPCFNFYITFPQFFSFFPLF